MKFKYGDQVIVIGYNAFYDGALGVVVTGRKVEVFGMIPDRLDEEYRVKLAHSEHTFESIYLETVPPDGTWQISNVTGTIVTQKKKRPRSKH